MFYFLNVPKNLKKKLSRPWMHNIFSISGTISLTLITWRWMIGSIFVQRNSIWIYFIWFCIFCIFLLTFFYICWITLNFLDFFFFWIFLDYFNLIFKVFFIIILIWCRSWSCFWFWTCDSYSYWFGNLEKSETNTFGYSWSIKTDSLMSTMEP